MGPHRLEIPYITKKITNLLPVFDVHYLYDVWLLFPHISFLAIRYTCTVATVEVKKCFQICSVLITKTAFTVPFT